MNKIMLTIILFACLSYNILQNEKKVIFENSTIEILEFEITNFELNQPWEDLSLGYINVIKVDSTWHLWYETFNTASKTYDDPSFNTFINYAYSNNGVDWIKPHLNILDYNGINNNIPHFNNFKENEGVHGLSVFYDEQANHNERFKIVYSKFDINENTSYVYGAVSSDGLNWERERLLFKTHFDTQTIMFHHKGKYRLYYRYRNNINSEKYRQIGYSSSETFDNNLKKNYNIFF